MYSEFQYTMHYGSIHSFSEDKINIYSAFSLWWCVYKQPTLPISMWCSLCTMYNKMKWKRILSRSASHTLCSTSGYVIFNFIFAFIFFVLVVGGLRWQIFLHWPTPHPYQMPVHIVSHQMKIYCWKLSFFDRWNVERCFSFFESFLFQFKHK